MTETAARLPLVDSFTGTYAFLSNFHLSRIADLGDGITYPTGEHAFQAQKTWNYEERARIARTSSPGAAKGLGRGLALRSDWESVKKPLMLRVELAKFRQDRELSRLLCGTGDAVLVEGNTWHDNYWGDCRCGRAACREPGRNYLGRILMAVRLVLRED